MFQFAVFCAKIIKNNNVREETAWYFQKSKKYHAGNVIIRKETNWRRRKNITQKNILQPRVMKDAFAFGNPDGMGAAINDSVPR